jgi:predicted alpha/beta superfamily hydrolase
MTKQMRVWSYGLCILLAGAAALPAAAQQDGDLVSIGTYRVIHSRILDEDRTLLVHLPRGYKEATVSYPVVYMLYGDHVTTYFATSVAAVDSLGSSGRTPHFILIGLMNTDRYRDLLPEANGNPTGIGDFTRFLSEELFPYVEENYRTKPYRILVGPQAAANFGLYAMMKDPGLFHAFILDNPFRWRGGQDLMMDMASAFFNDRGEFRRFLHIAYRDEDELEKEGLPALKKFAEIAGNSGCEGFRLKLDYLTETDFIPPLRIKEGLKELFADYPFPPDRKVDSLDDVLAYYKTLSGGYGFDVDVPDHVLAMQSYSLQESGKTEAMLEMLLYMLQLDPNSGNALWQLGNHYERTGELEKALECFERMIKFMGGDTGMIKARADALKKKIAEKKK